jgi:ABC-2 type transport system ATP-binding protein
MTTPTAATRHAVWVNGLGLRYRSPFGAQTWALRDCTFNLPAGRVAALVGSNGAGKTTLLSVLAGLLAPTEGSALVRGPDGPHRVSFVAQDKPVYRQFTARDMLRVGAKLNRVWDADRAENWLHRFEIPLDRRCGKLSGGQRTQVAFAVAIGARPDVLLLDEPLANLDPLARKEVTQQLLGEVADTGMTVVLSTHILPELGGVADHLLLLSRGRLLIDGDVDDVVTQHLQYIGPRADRAPGPGEVLRASHSERQSSFLVRLPADEPAPTVAEPWLVRPVALEDLVIAYLQHDRGAGGVVR